MIDLKGVTLDRRAPDLLGNSLKSRAFALLGGKWPRAAVRRVLEDVDLSVEPGEKVGIIGANGAGKSTLLKIVCGILTPTSGTARTLGRISPVLDLGAGLDPELPVVENITFYGVLFGYTRAHMLSRADDILAFAELADYRNAPVRALSSGMTARLGFAIATDMQPDILVVDEALSVGDARFRSKSQQRIEKMWSPSATALIVSHDLALIKQFCTRAVIMERGRIVFSGTPDDAVAQYARSADTAAMAVLARARSRLASS